VVDAWVGEEHLEPFDRHVGQAEALRDRARDAGLRAGVDARIGEQLVQLRRAPARLLEAAQLAEQRGGTVRVAYHIHDRAGVRACEASDHDWLTSRTLSAKSLLRSWSVIFSRRICSARSAASCPAYSVSSCRACLTRLSTSFRAACRIFCASAFAASIISRFCRSPSAIAFSRIEATSASICLSRASMSAASWSAFARR